jgi:ribonuclease III
MGLLRHFIAQIKRSIGIVFQEEALSSIDFRRLEKILHYPIHNRRLVAEALTHRSYLQVHNGQIVFSNERLEFLGDAVLNLVVAEYLFRHNTTAPEGDLTKIRSRLVNRKALSSYAHELSLADFLLMSPSAAQVTEKGLDTILADAYEALLGAIYLDGGFYTVQSIVERHILAALKEGIVKIKDENFKSQLLEYAQAKGLGIPRYVTIQEEGPHHERVFTVEVHIADRVYGVGKGTNKKDAEQAAAENTLQILTMS